MFLAQTSCELSLVLILRSNVSVPHRLIPTRAHATLATVMGESLGFPEEDKDISWRLSEDRLCFRLQFQEKCSPCSRGGTGELSLSQSLSFSGPVFLRVQTRLQTD